MPAGLNRTAGTGTESGMMPRSPGRLPWARDVVPTALLVRFIPIVLLAAGCATLQPPTPLAKSVTTEMLLEARPLLGDRELPYLPDTDVLALNQQMVEFLDSYVLRWGSADYAKLRRLVYVIMNEGGFGLEYDTQTRTAIETFQARRGNCLSFTNMFVAMAREIGIDARFQEVEIPPDWTFQEGAFVLNRHINVVVNLPHTGKRQVDFNIDDFQSSYERQQVSDRRALAHYYNNMGVEHMRAGESILALQYFLKAIDHSRDFGPTWANLATLYRRNGHLEYAEAGYFHALGFKSGKTVAMSNLVTLYEELGDADRAAVFRKRVNAHRMRNPYYRYQLGRQAFLAAEYEDAVRHFRSAIGLERNEHIFYYQLGLSYLKTGDSEKARRWLNRAVEVAMSDSVKRNYRDAIEKLLSGP